MTNHPEPELLTLSQFAKAIKKGRRTVQRWLADGDITSDMKLPGPTGAHLFHRDRVAQYDTTTS